MPNNIADFDWSSPVLGEDDLTLYPADTLDRTKYAKFLHGYLVNNASNGGYVLNLNAKWGAGKTYFINRWINSIKERHPVVYVDAWKQDYSDDPMLTVVSSIIEAFNKQLPEGNQTASNITAQASRFFKAAAPALMKGIVKKATGVNIDAVTEEASEAETTSQASSDFDGSSGAALAKALIQDHNEKLESIKHLRKEIKLLVEAVNAHNPEYNDPAFIFIDELDRCRPSYAVEMLEVIKHFFELDNIIFVIATDTEQLQHAVKAVYGEGFDAQTYLGRFFRRRYSLTELSRYEFIDHVVQNKITLESRWEHHIPRIKTLEGLSNSISIVANHFELSLRDTEQLVDKFVAVLNNTDKTMNPCLLLILFILRDKHNDLYQNWMYTTTKYTSFTGTGNEAKDLSKVFHISNHGIDNAFYLAIEENGGSSISYNLIGILEDMNTYSSEWAYTELHEYKRNLRNISSSSDYDEGNYFEMNYKLKSLALTAKKTDYINWVELSVSFNE